MIDALPKLLSRLKMRGRLSQRLNDFPGFGIAGETGWPIMQGKTAETPDFNALAAGQCLTHPIQKRLHDGVHIGFYQVVLVAGKPFN